MRARVHAVWMFGLFLAAAAVAPARAQVVMEFGDEDLCNTGTYATDPKAGATLFGLAAGAATFATSAFPHSFPFTPTAGDYAGTDQIYVGSTQTGSHDGYATYGGRIKGPQVIMLNYGSLIPVGRTIQTLTLGVGADDFQVPAFQQPFTASINGTTNAALTDALNGLSQTGPFTQFLTVGVNTAQLTNNNTLTLSINGLGDGGDGWAVDYLTVGLTFAPVTNVPEPGTVALVSASALSGAAFLRRRKRAAKMA